MLFALWAIAANGTAGLDASQVEAALKDAEPAPALRAAFRATLTSEKAVRQIEFDPLGAPGQRFTVNAPFGDDPELDRIVYDWSQEAQPDVRLYADDLRASMGRGTVKQSQTGWNISFTHKLSDNDGPMDAMVSQQMQGSMFLNAASGHLERLTYRIREPFRTEDGSVVTDYSQAYRFGRSERWGITFVTGYRLEAAGGRFGIRDSRTFQVDITDVAFTLANDAAFIEDSKPYRPRNPQPVDHAWAGEN
tara:strand:- start:90 stop:836 length:747 start_codon:yes stop_codon:yes gene_type:complete